MSEFVDALKTELESTFKEEVSIYFDINLHDGLLEMHDVDASLKDKLNHTNYRDQINKVANAINEIISALQLIQTPAAIVTIEPDISDVGRPPEKQAVFPTLGEKEPVEQQTKRADQSRAKKLIYSVTSSVIIILAVLSLLIFSSGSTFPFDKRDWILITDFENLTENPVSDNFIIRGTKTIFPRYRSEFKA